MNKLNKKTIIYISIISIFIIGIYYFLTKEEDYIESNSDLNILSTYEENTKIGETSPNTKGISESKIVIYITGAVKNQGIYELKENSRIADIIERAGGLTEEANIENINLAYILEDGMKIYVPKKGEENNEQQDNTNTYISKENGTTKNQTSEDEINRNYKININTATQTELETLPGIGPSTAIRIIEYRKEIGKFNNIEDIKKVSGIGDNKYNKIKDLIKI